MNLSRFIPIAVLFVTLALRFGSAQNLIANGDFEQADPKNPNQPAHWDTIDGLGIQWVTAPAVAGAPPHGKAIRMNTDLSEQQMNESWTKVGVTKWIIPNANGPISETYGLSLYSDPVPLVVGKAYRVTFDFMSEKETAGKVWLRGYGAVAGEERRLYESIIECKNTGGWKSYTGIFHPTKHNQLLTVFRIMLFAFYPAGVCWFDNVKVEAVDERGPN